MVRLLPRALPMAALFLVAVAWSAQAEDFTQRKATNVRVEQQEITILAESLACMALATDDAALKVCMDRKHQQLAAARSQFKPHP